MPQTIAPAISHHGRHSAVSWPFHVQNVQNRCWTSSLRICFLTISTQLFSPKPVALILESSVFFTSHLSAHVFPKYTLPHWPSSPSPLWKPTMGHNYPTSIYSQDYNWRFFCFYFCNLLSILHITSRQIFADVKSDLLIPLLLISTTFRTKYKLLNLEYKGLYLLLYYNHLVYLTCSHGRASETYLHCRDLCPCAQLKCYHLLCDYTAPILTRPSTSE